MKTVALVSQWINSNKAEKSILRQMKEKKVDLCSDLGGVKEVNVDMWTNKVLSSLVHVEELAALKAATYGDVSNLRNFRVSLQGKMTTKLAATEQIGDKLSIIHSMVTDLSKNMSSDGGDKIFPETLFKVFKKQFQSLAEEFTKFKSQHSDRAISYTRCAAS